jgi:hypothetical protein
LIRALVLYPPKKVKKTWSLPCFFTSKTLKG